MKPRIRHRRISASSSPELEKLADCVGEFIQYWGFKAVQGRLWLYLFASREPLSSIELAALLRVSPALVTQSVQVLLKYRVILAAPKGPNGVLRYEANPDAAEAIRTVLETRETRLLSRTAAQARKARNEAKKTSRPHALPLNVANLERVSAWVQLSQLVLRLGVRNLQGARTPFSDPTLYSELAVRADRVVSAGSRSRK